MRIAVAGATGTIGRHVVEYLGGWGHEVVQISRSGGVDVVTGSGLDAALSGVECIVDAASSHTPEQRAATAFFTAGARNLQQAGARAGARRLVVVSIIGVDAFRAGYMAAKVAHERAAREGPLPVAVVRAAQFHELVGRMVEWGRGDDVSRVPRMRAQLVAARAAGEVLARIAAGEGPAARAAEERFVEVAGPRPEDFVEAARRLVARRGDPVRIEGMADPADPDRAAYDSGAQLPGPGAILAGPTFDAWLDAELPPRPHVDVHSGGPPA
jgi:uncharacterized protein YbjT (DUF2867 family)